MAFRPAPAKGGWINPAGIQAWKKAASSYAGMPDRVEDSAVSAADQHVLSPALDAGAHPALAFFPHEEGNLAIGVSQDNESYQDAFDEEFGNGSKIPGAQVRTALWNNRDTAVKTFHTGLAG